MIHKAKALVFDRRKGATVAVTVELDIDLPKLSQCMAQKAINNTSKRTKFQQGVRARLVLRPEEGE